MVAGNEEGRREKREKSKRGMERDALVTQAEIMVSNTKMKCSKNRCYVRNTRKKRIG